jgi:hypothetical protein
MAIALPPAPTSSPTLAVAIPAVQPPAQPEVVAAETARAPSCVLCELPTDDQLLVACRRVLAGEKSARKNAALAEVLRGSDHTPEDVRKHFRYHRQRLYFYRQARGRVQAKADRLDEALSDRDRELLMLSSRVGALSVEQVAELFYAGHKGGGPKSSRRTAAGARLRQLADPDAELLWKYDLPHRPRTNDPHVAFALGRTGAALLDAYENEQGSDYNLRPAPYNSEKELGPALRGPSWRHNLWVNDCLVRLLRDTQERPEHVLPSKSGDRRLKLNMEMGNLWSAFHLALSHRVPLYAEAGKAVPTHVSSVFPDAFASLGCSVDGGPSFTAPFFVELDVGSNSVKRAVEQAWEYVGLGYSRAAEARFPELGEAAKRGAGIARANGQTPRPLWVPLLWVTGKSSPQPEARAARIAERIEGLLKARTFETQYRLLGTPPIYVTSWPAFAEHGLLAPVHVVGRDGVTTQRPFLQALIADSAVLRTSGVLGADHIFRLDRKGARAGDHTGGKR